MRMCGDGAHAIAYATRDCAEHSPTSSQIIAMPSCEAECCHLYFRGKKMESQNRDMRDSPGSPSWEGREQCLAP